MALKKVLSRLQDRVALVTGAGRGIGEAIAIRLGEEGALVVVNDVNLASAQRVAEKLNQSGAESIAIKADVSDSHEVETMFAEVEKHFGGVDILVNNAGIRRDAPLEKIAEKDWDRVIAVHLKGSFNCVRSAQKYMVTKNAGKIVNLSSPVPSCLGERELAYASASSAMWGFTRALALELGRHNINVNCVAPEFIDTPMTRDRARQEGMYMDDFRRAALSRVPLRRMGTPHDVANLVLFLVTEESSFISGQVIHIKGGP